MRIEEVDDVAFFITTDEQLSLNRGWFITHASWELFFISDLEDDCWAPYKSVT